jgi:SDR family mycofactocin-dependent oxidoreductase
LPDHKEAEHVDRVAGKVILITGAARGQGRSHAVMLAAQGADIIAVDGCGDRRDMDTVGYPLASVDDLAETIRLVEAEGRRALKICCDVRNRQQLTTAVTEVIAELGRLDVVVANAGIAPLSSRAPKGFVDAIDVNLVGAINTISACLPHLAAGASIIATGSFAAFSGTVSSHTAGAAGYKFSKKALSHYINDLAAQLGPESIRVNAVHPTNVNTAMLHSPPVYEQFVPDGVEPTREAAEAAFPVLQAFPISWVEPEDVSSAVVFLASDESRFVTGMQLRVDGGALVKSRAWTG